MIENIATTFAYLGIGVVTIVVSIITLQFANNASRNMAKSNLQTSKTLGD